MVKYNITFTEDEIESLHKKLSGDSLDANDDLNLQSVRVKVNKTRLNKSSYLPPLIIKNLDSSQIVEFRREWNKMMGSVSKEEWIALQNVGGIDIDAGE